MRSVLSRLAGIGTFAALALKAGVIPPTTVLAVPQSSARSSAALRESAVDLPGVRLWYSDSGGSGVPVVFMHAATGSVRNWEHQVGALTSAGYRFIAFDRRGWGRTVIEPSGPQPGTAADDLEGLVKHLGIDRFHLVGTAAGGFVALDYAVSFASRLRSVVMANSIGGVQDEEYAGFVRLHSAPFLPTFASWGLPTAPPTLTAHAAGSSWRRRAGHRRHRHQRSR